MNQDRLEASNVLWFIFFSFASWLIFTSLFMTQKIFDLFYEFYTYAQETEKSANEKRIPVIVTNPKEDKKEKPDILEKLYRSDRAAEARGRLTQKKGFRWLSEQDQLEYKTKYKINSKEYNEDEVYIAKIIRKKDALYKFFFGKKKYEPLSKIPDSYRFNYDHAFSWDKQGSPQIPSYHYKHFRYIRSMIEKIRYHWSPPGGFPSPVYTDPYHQSYYVPGYFKVRLFSPHEIAIVFMLDEKGYVIDVKVFKSGGYRSLDNSIVEAITDSQNFGPPPRDMIKLDKAIFPWLFKIY